MYTLLPAAVSLLFLGYGAYVLVSRGINRVSASSFVVFAITFCWQFMWSILFQIEDEAQAMAVARLGWLPILFLPTAIYYFVTELTQVRRELRFVAVSFALACTLAVLLFSSDLLIAGTYRYRFGFYPKAGPLHALHLAQTAVVCVRSLYILYSKLRDAHPLERVRLRYCFVSLLIYFLAAVDYACNYGAGFYPPGVLFVALSLGIMAQAVARHDLLANPVMLANPMMLAAIVVHEMRTPLATIRGHARFLSQRLPELVDGYAKALAAGGPGRIDAARLDYLRDLGRSIEVEVQRTNFIAEIVLANSREGPFNSDSFGHHSVAACVEEALACYPFDDNGRARVRLGRHDDFLFFGSRALMVLLLYNLIKNALAAVREGDGAIEIAYHPSHLSVTDTGRGIAPHVLPRVFEPFYTTQPDGTGLGLAFCKRVVTAFGGRIGCESKEGVFTTVAVELPACGLQGQAA